MPIDIWSDVVCPWCAIGKAHLDLALARFAHAKDVRVAWRSCELHPGAPAARDGDYSALLAAKYGASPAGGKAMVARLSAAAERAGVLARFDLVRPANTFDAHRVLHFANGRGRQDALVARLTRAYLAEGELLSDHPTLQRLGEEVGLPATDLAHALDGGAYAQQVRADKAEAGRREVTAVPAFLVDRRYVIPGAQSPESILATLSRAWSAQLAGRGHESELSERLRRGLAVSRRTAIEWRCLVAVAAVGAAALDQAGKRVLAVHETGAVLGPVTVVLIHNAGGADGVLAGHPALARVLDLGLTVLLLALAMRLSGQASAVTRVLWGLLLGGALGNAADRVGPAGVVDWLRVAGYPAAFNLADVFVRLAAVGLAISLLGGAEVRRAVLGGAGGRGLPSFEVHRAHWVGGLDRAPPLG